MLYTLVSAIAWLVDVAVLYFTALQLDAPPYMAAAVGYSIGLLVHYALSVRYVFEHRRMANKWRAELLLYVFTGLLGIALSAGIVHLGSLLNLSLIVSKLLATGIAFAAIFAIRKIALFSGDQRRSGERA